MLKVWDKYTDEDELYFHTITDCGPYLSTVVATTSNDFDSGSTPSQIGYFMEEVEAAETTDDNIHTIGLAYIARDISKHRALAQHMMIRILGDIQVSGDYICEAIFGAKVPPALRTWFGQQPHDIKKQLTNQQVCDIQKDVVDHVNLTGESDAENKFLLQDLYANWIWQLTLIHIFNVKYGVDNNNIGGTDVTTTHDAAAAAGDGAAGVLQVEEKKASLAMFFRLSQFSFYMGHLVNTRVLKCKVQNSGEWDDHSSRAPKDPANLNDCYQNVVNLFYRDFWKPLFDSQVIATSRLWLEHAESKGWCEFTTAQPGVAGFLRDAFRQGAPKATSGTHVHARHLIRKLELLGNGEHLQRFAHFCRIFRVLLQNHHVALTFLAVEPPRLSILLFEIIEIMSCIPHTVLGCELLTLSFARFHSMTNFPGVEST